MQDIADSLGVSRVSVWKVFHNQPGVSDSLKNGIIDMATKLGYSGITGLVPFNSKKSYKTISLVVSETSSTIFLTEMIHSIAKELSLHSVNLMYTYMPKKYSEGFQLPDILKSIDGIIVLNTYNNKIIELLNKLDTPKVFLDTSPESNLNCDLVLVEGRLSTSRIVSNAIKKGYKSFGFIGDISYSRSNLERYNGFIESLNQHNIPFNPDVCLATSIEPSEYKTRIFSFLDSISKLPDVFICANHNISQLVSDYIATYPEHFNTPLLITGFGVSSDSHNNISTTNISMKELGKKLALQILYRIDSPTSPKETVYLHPKIS